MSERVPLDSDVWKIVRLHGIGLEQLDIYWHGAIQYLELRWKKHVFKAKRDAIAYDLRREGYTVRMTGKLSNLDDMKRELKERFNKLEKRQKVIWEEPIQSQARVLDMQDVTACLSLFKNFLVENLNKITFTSEMRGYRPGYHWYDPNTKEIVIGYPFKEDVIADFEETKEAQLSNLAHEFGHHIDFQISGLREKCDEIARKKNASCSREGFASLISWIVSDVKVYEYYKYSDLSILEEITSTIRDAAFI